MRNSRQILAMTLVAAVLCADRVGNAAAPALREPVDQIDQAARHLVNRLSVSLRRVAPVMRLDPTRREGLAPRLPAAPAYAEPVCARRTETQPFQFRLPPPTDC